MKSFLHTPLRLVFWMAVFTTIAWSCQQEKVISPATQRSQATTAARDNGQIVTATQDIADLTTSALVGQGITGGRVAPSAKLNHHSGCEPIISGTFRIDKTHRDSIVYQGTLILDFGDGSTCEDSTEVRKGRIIDSFLLIILRRDSISFSLTDSITFDGFVTDSIQVDGLFIKKATSCKIFTIDIQDARITYADGTSVTWSGSLTTTFGRGVREDHGDGDDDDDNDDGEGGDDDDHDSTNVSDGGRHGFPAKKVTGEIHGTTREGAAFTAEITKEVVYDLSCSKRIPVSGTIVVTVGGIVSTLDFGNGKCDRKYTITTGETTTEFTFSKHGHS